MAQLYADAAVVAVWTTAHARYLVLCETLVEPPHPTVHTVPSYLNELDLSDLFARRTCPRMAPKLATPTLSILQRSTNPGSRGWDSLLKESVANSASARLMCTHSLTVSLAGLHPFLHPALRKPWHARAKTVDLASLHLSTYDHVLSAVVEPAAPMKEAVRRTLACIVAVSPATFAALHTLQHPIGFLTMPPHQLPARGLEAAMDAFAEAGSRLFDIEHSATTPGCLAAIIKGTFQAHSKKASEAHPSNADKVLSWDPPWLGKGTASVHSKVSLVSVASELFSTSFRTHFLVFWAHAMSHQLRACRLDSTQHAAIHSLNAVTKLCAKLSEDDALAVQRAALQHKSAGLLTIEEASELLGCPDVRGTSSNGGAKGAIDACEALSVAGPEAMAKLLHFARAAWLSEELLIVDLGRDVYQAQARALCRRFRVDPGNDPRAKLNDLPIHATTLLACCECHRVANAHSVQPFIDPGTVKAYAMFNELGVSSSMQSVDAGKVVLRCAKRSSAALKTALAFEEEMQTRIVEDAEIHTEAISQLFRNQHTADSGLASRVRRDAKNSFEQRSQALSCGELPMATIPLVGRAVRLWSEWYTLCALCGACFRVYPNNRFGGQLCCLRCDPELLGVDVAAKAAEHNSMNKQTVCRFCGKVDLQRSGARWKLVKSPRDESGRNHGIPPPLRFVHFCPSHYRNWIPAAMRVLPTRVILAHLALNARPVYGAEANAAECDRPLDFDDSLLNGPVRKRRRRGRASAAAANAAQE
tara:strand:- start:12100 stop:14373 length:2274 start_codon:yes stop_codon:yes gene_type:complete